MNMSDSEEPVSRETLQELVKKQEENTWSYIQSSAQARDYIGTNYGDDAVWKYFEEEGRDFAIPLLEFAAAAGAEGGELLMKGTLEQMNSLPDGNFELTETDTEMTVQGRCGSGGRWIREGKAARNAEGVPYYCFHCLLWWDEWPKQIGVPMSFHRSETGESCAWKLQKSPEASADPADSE
jgi:hypothetical protein